MDRYAPEEGARFVQDRIAREGDGVLAVPAAGGRVCVCGDGRRMAPVVREAFTAIHRGRTGAGDEETTACLEALIAGHRALPGRTARSGPAVSAPPVRS